MKRQFARNERVASGFYLIILAEEQISEYRHDYSVKLNTLTKHLARSSPSPGMIFPSGNTRVELALLMHGLITTSADT